MSKQRSNVRAQIASIVSVQRRGFAQGATWRATASSALGCFFLIGLCAYAAAGGTPVRLGQSLTLLPNGEILLAGGYGNNHVPTADLFLTDTMGRTNPLPVKMLYARAGHSSTVLPNGQVLIFGGYGVNGGLVSAGELLDMASGTSTLVSGFRLLPRAFHTATVLTDGTLVAIGGVGTGGELIPDIQVWDYRTGTTLAYDAGLSVPRWMHHATLLPNGNVLISDGLDRVGKSSSIIEEYDPSAHRFSLDSSSPMAGELAVEGSIPLDGATDVHLTDILAVRFGSPMSVVGLNSTNVTLKDSGGNWVHVSVNAAESGRLVFASPTSPLQFGTTYVLTLSSLTDSGGNQLPTKTIQFTTQTDPQDPGSEEWIPGPSDFNGQWHSHTGPSEWQKLPALQAKAGVTALAGQVLRLNGRPLQHVLLQIDNRSAFTDQTGRFVVTNVSSGHHPLLIDGRTANRPGVTYGLFEVGVNIVAGKTTALNYTIWMTKLDTLHAVTIPSPTVAADTVVTTPVLPGLELHIPQNTVIVDHDGHTVHQLTITAVPLDKPPFPLPPGVQVPIYFTIQPGGAYIDVRGYSSSGIKGARLVYPNPYHSPAGTQFNFWNYDADSKGWYVYGRGKVSKDALHVVPDAGVVIYELTGAMVGDAGGPYPFPPPCQDSGGGGDSGGSAGDPVDLYTGNFVYKKTDLYVSDTIPLQIRRTYRNNDSVSRAFGIGTSFNYDMYMTGDQHPYTYQELIEPDGSRTRFTRISPGNSYTDAFYVSSFAPSQFYGSTIPGYGAVSNNFGGSWTIQKNDGTSIFFPDSDSIPNYRNATPLGITDRYGNALTFVRNDNGDLTEVDSPNGKYIRFTYDASDRIIQATDNIGRSVNYTYDSAGRLQTVQDVNGGITTYIYDGNNNMLTVQDPRNITFLTNQYDSSGRVIQQTLANGGTYQFNWTPTQNTSEVFSINDPNGAGADGILAFRNCAGCSEGYSPVIAQVDVTDPRGYVRRVVFDSLGRKASDTRALGQPEQQTATFQYNSDNTMASSTDALGRQTTYTYDANLNLTQTVQMAGSASPIATAVTYDPQYNQITSVTDSRGVTTFTAVPDGSGHTSSMTDALGNTASATYNSDGTTASYTDAAGNTVRFGYDNGFLTSIVDPAGSKTLRFLDGLGRVLGLTDRAGHQALYQYDNSSQALKSTDFLGNNTSYSYDANGNLLSLTDPPNHTISYTYDSMDEVATRTDPLQRQESYTYDLDGDLVTFVDRKGQVTTYTYDGLQRPVSASFGVSTSGGTTTYASTVTYQYDAGNRMTQAVDSVFGAITRSYDTLGHIVSETTPQGSITYTYDAIGRRSSMQVTGQPQVTYVYDNANHVTQIAQGSSKVTATYDNAGRRSTLTLPNGVLVTYSYDQNSNVTGIAYSQNGNPIGNLTYTYDVLGRRVSVGGSLATSAMPPAVSSAVYDAANELTNWNGAALSYDANGNIVNDGTHGYIWDSRNHLSAIDSGSTGSFAYDPFGRRAAKTIQGTATGFFYDGSSIVQELSGNTPVANLLTGGTDEVFARTDSNGTSNYLTSALGSVIALTDSTGAIQTQYSYDPYGATTSSGAATTNTIAFTGRENDGTGLYYYRQRYYSPALGRFISEDPVGLAGSKNLYSYAGNQPTGFKDPSGLWSPDAHDAIFQYALGGCAPQSNIDTLKSVSRQFDLATGEDGNWDFAHSMSQPGQSLQDFYNQRDNWINSEMLKAEQEAQTGDTSDALTDLAKASHTVEDAYSPMHMKGGPNGVPFVWDCGPGHWLHCFESEPGKPWYNNWRHSPGKHWWTAETDWLGGETVGVWNDEPATIKNAVRLDLLNAYQAVFGPCEGTSGRKN